MQLNVAKEIAAMEEMPVAQLRNRYAEVFGETTNGRNKQWLLKKVSLAFTSRQETIPCLAHSIKRRLKSRSLVSLD